MKRHEEGAEGGPENHRDRPSTGDSPRARSHHARGHRRQVRIAGKPDRPQVPDLAVALGERDVVDRPFLDQSFAELCRHLVTCAAAPSRDVRQALHRHAMSGVRLCPSRHPRNSRCAGRTLAALSSHRLMKAEPNTPPRSRRNCPPRPRKISNCWRNSTTASSPASPAFSWQSSASARFSAVPRISFLPPSSSSRGSAQCVGPHAGWRHVDEPPFPWLQGMVSSNALLLTVAVLIRQNRMAQMAEHRSHLDLQINLLAEQKVSKILQIVDELHRELKVAHGVPPVAHAGANGRNDETRGPARACSTRSSRKKATL